jgi:predicted peptidase
MKNFVSLILFIPYLLLCQEECAPCDILANPGMEITRIKSDWPTLSPKNVIRINSLTAINYGDDDKYWELSERPAWWKNEKSDPWSPTTNWVDNYIEPSQDFLDCNNDELRWKCGYSYNLKLPENFKKNKKYPLVIFLHGGVREFPRSLTWKVKNLDNFYVPEEDPYVIAAPFKLGIDWSPKRIMDIIEDIKLNLNIDANRIYLTGLSMGGRGTFIVAAELSNTFAAIMPLSPHHTPYSYLSLAEKVSHLPTFLHHSTNDKTSKFSVAEDMFSKLGKINDNVVFDIGNFGHSGWNKIYSNPKHIEWLLSWRK